MSTFVLVHGAWHGAWCWRKVVPLLESPGHRVIALDLPGHGDDATPPQEVTLEDYAEHIAATVAKEPEPVVLVGHSMGGAAITQAAERCAADVGVLVYVAAFVPGDGVSVVDQAQSDPQSLLTAHISADLERGVACVHEAAIDACFYGDCAPEDVAFARAHLRDEPIVPLMAPLSLGDPRARALPRVYVECVRDVAVSLDHQRAMRTHLAWDRVCALDTDHSPFLSAPEALVEPLLAAGELAG
jgi:pimeloyl-ACP methyl ester carboxylesterase